MILRIGDKLTEYKDFTMMSKTGKKITEKYKYLEKIDDMIYQGKKAKLTPFFGSKVLLRITQV